MSAALLNALLPVAGQLVLLVLYHYGIVRPGAAAKAAPSPPVAVPVDPPASGIPADHPLRDAILARIETRLGQWAQAQVDQVLAAPPAKAA